MHGKSYNFRTQCSLIISREKAVLETSVEYLARPSMQALQRPQPDLQRPGTHRQAQYFKATRPILAVRTSSFHVLFWQSTWMAIPAFLCLYRTVKLLEQSCPLKKNQTSIVFFTRPSLTGNHIMHCPAQNITDVTIIIFWISVTINVVS